MKEYKIIKNKDINHIIFFDYRCKFCNFWINFIIKKDKTKIFHFANTNGNYIKSLDIYNQIKDLQTIILYTNDKYYIKSNAIITILIKLGGIFKLFKLFLIIPSSILDKVYECISKNRYKINLNQENKKTCNYEEKDLIKDRFLE
jgi:predicted DCC family thiol-disulfide oxidoreductase YuxK